VKPEVKPEPKLKPKQKVKETPVSDEPVSDEPPPPMRFDMSNIAQGGGSSGVGVQIGTPGGVPGGTGKPGGKGKGTRPPDAETGGEVPWEPRSEIFVKKLPAPVKVPKINCPASLELGIEGTVVLKVQVRRDGRIRSVRVSKGFDKRCDKVARDALRKARFKPAVATNGKPVDYELRYEYEFRLTD
jgi:protein TonB